MNTIGYLYDGGKLHCKDCTSKALKEGHFKNYLQLSNECDENGLPHIAKDSNGHLLIASRNRRDVGKACADCGKKILSK
jgi:hypothetical protein